MVNDKNKVSKKVIAGISAAVLVGAAVIGGVGFTIGDNGISQEDVNAARVAGADSVDITADNAEVIAEAVADAVADAVTEVKAIEAAKLAEKQAELDAMILADAEEVATALAEELEVSTSYFIDEVELDGNFAETIDSNDYEKLVEYEIEYNDEDIDVEETLTLTNGVSVNINEEDFGSEILLSVDEGSISYTVEFDDPVDVTDDETLDFKFLGEDVSISEVDGDEVMFSQGTEVFLQEGTSTTFGEYVVTLEAVSSNDKVLVKVTKDGVSMSDTIKNSETINDLDISVQEAFARDEGLDFAELKLSASDVEFEAVDGDDYEFDDRYNWVIDATGSVITSIGIVLDDEVEYVDEYSLSLGESVSLPNDYLTLTYDALDYDVIEDLEVSLKGNSVDVEEIKIDFSGDIELDGDNVEDVVFDLENNLIDYSGFDDEEDTIYNLTNEIMLEVGDREIYVSVSGTILTIDNIDYGFTTTDGDNYFVNPTGFDDDEDVRNVNGDILLSIDEDDEDVNSLGFEFVDDETEVTIRVD